MTYTDWNEKLLAHVFGRRSDATDSVSRIPATPEELWIVAGKAEGAAKEEIDALVAQFVECARAELEKEKKGFLRYCLYYREDRSWWTPQGYQQPYFFGMLWLTCLIAYGYPDANEGDFYARARAVFSGSVNLQDTAHGGLDDVWEDLAKWLREHPEHRELVLPPRCSWRTNIGRSHFLAFPHRFDRTQLAASLHEAGLVGREPPVRLVIEMLFDQRGRFSSEFQEDLDRMINDYLAKGQDPKDNAFWRAVRQEALSPSVGAPAQRPRPMRASLLAQWDDDGMLLPFVGFSADWVPPADWTSEDLEVPMDRLSRCAHLDAQRMEELLDHPLGRLEAEEARAIGEGVVPLLEVVSKLYRVGIGDGIASCDIVLVRDAMAIAVTNTFGGRSQRSSVRGWTLVTEARLEQRDELEVGLSGVKTLLQITDAPQPVLVGGIRALGNTFYALQGYLPVVRARSAVRVVVSSIDGAEPCLRVADDTDEWQLPAGVLEHATGMPEAELKFDVIAYYHGELLGHSIDRQANSTFCLRKPVLATQYRGLAAGSFQLETCARAVQTIQGPCASIPLGFTSDAFERTLDVLPFDPTARWLGPGFGQMSLDSSSGFPWLAVGAKNRPEYLILSADDPASAPLPDERGSPSKGDQRHWRKAFAEAQRVVWKHGDVYVDRREWPASAETLLQSYRTRPRAGPVTMPAPETRLGTQPPPQEPWGVEEAVESATTLLEVLAAVSENQSGLPLVEVHQHIGRVFGLQEAHQLREHLVRALAEGGAIDTLRRSDGRQTHVVARRPRLVAYRRGVEWTAALVGLVPPKVRREFSEAVGRVAGARITEQRSANAFLPAMLRVTLGEREHLRLLSDELAFAAPEYLDWPDANRLPEAFRVVGEIANAPAPDMYEVDATWCWETGAFRHDPQAGLDEMVVERRRHGARVPIYVLRRGLKELGWSYSRTWALLTAYEKSGRPFLAEEQYGAFVIDGESPLHLPLPLGRLCAIVGVGLPGPRVAQGVRLKVEAYCYPFGPHLRSLLLPFVPKAWLQPRDR